MTGGIDADLADPTSTVADLQLGDVFSFADGRRARRHRVMHRDAYGFGRTALRTQDAREPGNPAPLVSGWIDSPLYRNSTPVVIHCRPGTALPPSDPRRGPFRFRDGLTRVGTVILAVGIVVSVGLIAWSTSTWPVAIPLALSASVAAFASSYRSEPRRRQ